MFRISLFSIKAIAIPFVGCLSLFLALTMMAQGEALTIQTANIGTNQVTLEITSNVASDAYFTLLSGSAASCGSSTNLVNGQDSTGSMAIHGSLELTAGVTGQYTIHNLLQGSTYTICAAPDGTSAPQSAQFTTSTHTSAASQWTQQGAGVTSGAASLSSLVLAPDGTPYIAYSYGSNSDISVMEFVNGSWTQMGTVLPSGTDLSLTFSPNGTLYLTYQSQAANNPIVVLQYANGGWTGVGTILANGSYPTLAFSPDGTPYLAYDNEANNNDATVMEFTNGSWTQVGTAIASGSSISLSFSPAGIPYLAYSDANSNNATMVTELLNGSWTQVGSAMPDGSKPTLSFSPSGTPYLVYQGLTSNGPFLVMEFTNGSWTQLGSNIAAGASPSLAFSPTGTPYLAYVNEASSSAVTVVEYLNGSWTQVGSAMAAGYDLTLAFSPAGTAYLTSDDMSQNIILMAYQAEPTMTTAVASAITPSTVTLSGAINPNDLSLTSYFQYSISVNGPFVLVPAITASGVNALATTADPVSVSANLSGMTPGTLYYYRMMALDSNYVSYIGQIQEFTASQLSPTVSAWPTATGIAAGQPLLTATLQGGVASVPGNFNWTNPVALAAAGAASYPVTFEPTDSAQYASITQPVTLTATSAAAGTPAGSLFFSNIAANQLTLALTSSVAGEAYFTMLAGGGQSCGTIAQTLLGEDSAGNMVIHGSIMLTAGTAQQYTVTNLAQNTTYTVCYSTDQKTMNTSSVMTHQMTDYSGNTAWSSMAEFINPTAENINSNLTFAPDGTPYIAITTYSFNLDVLKLVAGKWISLSPTGVTIPAFGGNTAINNVHVSLAFSPSGTLYIAYPEDTSNGSYTLNVAEYSGSSWIQLGSVATPSTSLPENSIAGKHISLVFAPDGTPYIGYSGLNGNSIDIDKYSDGTWTPIAAPSTTNAFLGLAVAPNGTLYLTSENSYSVRVDQYSDSGWSQVDPGFTIYDQSNNGVVIAPDGTLYLSGYSNLYSYQNGLWNTDELYPVHYYGAFSAFAIAPNNNPYAVLQGNQVLFPYQGNWNAFTPTLNSDLLFMISFAPDGTMYGIAAGEFTDLNNPAYSVYKFAPVVEATTETASNITMTAAMLNGSINTSGMNSNVYFEFGTTTSYGSVANAILNANDSAATAQLSSLTPNTVYHFRLDVVSGGTVVDGADQTFTTLTAVAPTLTITAPSTGFVYGEPATVSVLTSSAATGGVPVAGTLYASIDTGASTSMPISSDGKTTVAISNTLAAGNHSLVVTFTPNDTFDYTSTTQTFPLNVAKANSTATLTSDTSSLAPNQGATLTATVADASNGSTGTPTGVVAFMNGNTQLGTETLSSGTATFSVPVSDLSPGQSYLFTANYLGDTNFNPSASSATGTNITVEPTSFQLSSAGSSGTPNQSVKPGGTAIYSLKLTPGSGDIYPGSVTFSASGLPPGATASFSPATLPANAGPQTVSLTIQLPTATTTAESRNPFEKGAPILLGSLLLPLLGLRRARKNWMRSGFMIAVLLVGGLAGVASLTGCGSRKPLVNASANVQPQNYTITVTATSGGASHSIPVSLTVNN